jgi:hypothetical protein
MLAEEIMWQGVEITKANAPVRTSPPAGRYGKSLYPGFLKNVGISGQVFSDNSAKVQIGNDEVDYAGYANKTSRKAGYIEKSFEDLAKRIEIYYNGERE